jgi:uncharacterized protein (DUF1501 family)
MKSGAMAIVGTAAIPSFLTRAAWGAVSSGSGNKRLVVIFQRGAADGLNIVVPHAEPAYYAMRRGGRVYGRWPGLDPLRLNEGRDLALTTDFRRVLGEAVSRHLGNTHLNAVFPGFDNQPDRFLEYLD